MSTVTKLGAYGLAVAAALAVAFAILVTAPRSSVDAQTSPTVDATSAATDGALGDATYTNRSKKAGAKLYIGITTDSDTDGNRFRFAIDSASSAEATFTAAQASSNGKGLVCSDAETVSSATCDRDHDADEITVQIQIDKDAANGRVVIVNVANIDESGNVSTRFVFDVTRAAVPAKLIAKIGDEGTNTWPSTIGAEPDDLNEIARIGNADTARERDMTRVFVKLEDKAGNEIPGNLSITTTNGLIFAERGLGSSCGSAASGIQSIGVSRCNAPNFDGAGHLPMWGTGTPGVATVTLTVGDLTQTVKVTLYGPAKDIAAEADQSSVQVGGSVFIVATVTDGAGNAVAGHSVTVLTSGDDAIQAPAGDDSVAVTTDGDVEKDVTGTENDAPGCDSGTNAKGKCVVQVTAPNPDGTVRDATRGVHTITLSGSAPIAEADRKVQVEITVAGAVDSIETDAPERVAPGSRTDIKVTLKDDEGVLAGAQAVKVSQVDGPGRLIGGAEAITSNGSRTFTFRAANSMGTAEFDIEVRGLNTAGDAGTGKVLKSESITIAIGDEPAPALPEQPTAAGITSDAPDRVEPGSSTDITVTVTDAEGEQAGMQSVTATQVSGDGRIINGGPAATEDGEYTFTFRAAGTTGVAEIDVDVRSLVDGAATTTGRVLRTLSLTIQVGEPEPEMATLTPAPSGSGVALTLFSGGSVSDLQAVLLSECSSASVTAYTTVGGNWVPFIPGSRIAAVNAAFIAAVASDGMVPAGMPLTVSGCD